MTAIESAVDAANKNPYVGPRPFEVREDHLFFGRDWEAEELEALIIAHPAVLLYAQSGAGKSSLLNAKVLRELEAREGCEVLPVARVRGEGPTADLLAQIENLYVFNTLTSWCEINQASPAELVDLSITEFLRQLPRRGDDEGYPVLRVLVFDQFEELFAFYPEHWPEREGFFQQITAALAADAFLRVLFVIREDYLAQLDAYTDKLPEQLRSRFRLERLRRETALAAVEGPLEGTRCTFAPGVANILVDELLKIRVEGQTGQMSERPGEYVEPVQLQVVCQSLWAELPPHVTEITSGHLQAFGNIDQALTRFYENAVGDTVRQTGRFPVVDEWRLRNWFEHELITRADTRGLVHRGSEKTGSVPNAAVDVLESHHLIRGEHRAGARWYELTHDRFISPIQRSNAQWRVTVGKKWGGLGAGVAVFIIFGLFIVAALQSIMGVERTAATVTVAASTAQAEARQAAGTATAAASTAQAEAARLAATATEAALLAEVEAEVVAATVTAAASTAEFERIKAATAAAVVESTSTALAQRIRKDRVRPLRAGLGLGVEGETRIGTLGYFVVDEVGQVYLLSRAGVLGSNLNADLILQPGPVDGGKSAEDGVALLSSAPPLQGLVPADHMINLARLAPNIGVETIIPEIGPVRGVRAPEIGMRIHKVGRTTGLTSGQITDFGRDIQVGLGGRLIQLQDTIWVELESLPGDEGALVVDNHGYAVGVLIGTFRQITILAPMQAVLDAFEVRLPDPVETAFVIAPDGATMLFIPAGAFEMGSESGGSDEKPVHTVTLDAYYIDQYEVTNAQYAECVNRGLCSPPSDSRSYTRDSYYGNPEFDDYPVIHVTWEQAKTYCEWRDARLPTEAEWEKAARGTDGRLYPWGDTFDGDLVNFCDGNCEFRHANREYDDGYDDTAPVGSFSKGVSPYGVHDLAGNVWEWVNDGYEATYYANSPSENPTGPQSRGSKVLRGGSWSFGADDVRVANRSRPEPVTGISIGFRCADGGEAR